MWIMWLLVGILGWLLSGFASFVILAKAVGYTKVDEEVKEVLSKCLFGGFVTLIFIPITLFFMFMQEFFYKFLNRLLKWMNGGKKDE